MVQGPHAAGVGAGPLDGCSAWQLGGLRAGVGQSGTSECTSSCVALSGGTLRAGVGESEDAGAHSRVTQMWSAGNACAVQPWMGACVQHRRGWGGVGAGRDAAGDVAGTLGWSMQEPAQCKRELLCPVWWHVWMHTLLPGGMHVWVHLLFWWHALACLDAPFLSGGMDVWMHPFFLVAWMSGCTFFLVPHRWCRWCWFQEVCI